MPITDTDGDTYTLIGITVDAYTRIATGILRVDPAVGEIEPEALTIKIEGDAIFAQMPTPGLTRGQDIVNALYQHCLDTGLVSGVIS